MYSILNTVPRGATALRLTEETEESEEVADAGSSELLFGDA